MIRRTTTKSSRNVQISIIFRVFAWTLIIFIIPFQVILQQPLISNTTSLILSNPARPYLLRYLLLLPVPVLRQRHVPKRAGPGALQLPAPQAFSLHHNILQSRALPGQLHRPDPARAPSLLDDPRNPRRIVLRRLRKPLSDHPISASILPAACIEMFHTYKYRYIAYCILTVLLLISSFSGIYLGEQFRTRS